MPIPGLLNWEMYRFYNSSWCATLLHHVEARLYVDGAQSNGIHDEQDIPGQ